MIFVINKDFARIAETTHHRDGPLLLMCILSSWALLTWESVVTTSVQISKEDARIVLILSITIPTKFPCDLIHFG